MTSSKNDGPARLRDGDLSPLERALLDEGASYRSSASARAKTLAALGLMGSAAVAATASAAVASTASAASGGVAVATKVGLQLTLAKALIAVSAVGAVSAVPLGYYGWHQHRAVVEARQTARAIAAAPARAPVAAAAAPAAEVVPQQSQNQPNDDGNQDRVRRLARSGSTARAAVPGARLRRELLQLDAVREALAANDAMLALDLLDRYDRVHPRGGLALEAEVLRIDALVKAGRRDLARRRAEAFLRRHPDTVLTGRVRDYVGD